MLAIVNSLHFENEDDEEEVRWGAPANKMNE